MRPTSKIIHKRNNKKLLKPKKKRKLEKFFSCWVEIYRDRIFILIFRELRYVCGSVEQQFSVIKINFYDAFTGELRNCGCKIYGDRLRDAQESDFNLNSSFEGTTQSRFNLLSSR